jgi:hypothetical protein
LFSSNGKIRAYRGHVNTLFVPVLTFDILEGTDSLGG